MPSETAAFIHREPAYRWIEDFQSVVFSCAHALVKPDPAIYRLSLSQLGAKPAECLFLDDTPGNIDAAAALGIHGLLFRSAPEDASVLRDEWGLPVRSLEID
jgi:FMN phosphatase YigB (HAD superfamily)